MMIELFQKIRLLRIYILRRSTFHTEGKNARLPWHMALWYRHLTRVHFENYKWHNEQWNVELLTSRFMIIYSTRRYKTKIKVNRRYRKKIAVWNGIEQVLCRPIPFTEWPSGTQKRIRNRPWTRWNDDIKWVT